MLAMARQHARGLVGKWGSWGTQLKETQEKRSRVGACMAGKGGSVCRGRAAPSETGGQAVVFGSQRGAGKLDRKAEGWQGRARVWASAP